MQKTLLWTGREYRSLERCVITTSNTGARIESTISGYYENKIYKVDYSIETNDRWETQFFEVRSRIDNRSEIFTLKKDGNGNWNDGKKADKFPGCVDIDISLTPFTNSLPLNRMRLPLNEERVVQILYIDVLASRISPVRQRYVRLSELLYHFENIPNDFQADILVDEDGFVVNYPGLFVRTALV